MRTDTGHVFHLSDYRPTDFILETVDLVFRLDPKRTEVVSTLNSAGGRALLPTLRSCSTVTRSG